MDKPLVSVSIVTYNHQNYISQAIDSVLMQKTTFDYEILIGEDDSEDNTRAIVKEYKERYPDRIRLFLNSRENVIYVNGRSTGKWNAINNWKHARGQYIALCEGDDYWTDPNKLQKQVDFLESHQDCVICFHWVKWLDQESGKIMNWKYGPHIIKPYYTMDDLLEISGNFIPTCSTMYRYKLFNEFPDWYYRVGIGDYPLHILNAQYGKMGFLDEPMAVYRYHKGGAYGGKTRIENIKISLHTRHIMGINLGLNRRLSFRTGLSELYVGLCKAYKKEGKYIKAFCACIKSMTIAPRKRKKNTLVCVLSILFPLLVKSLVVIKNDGVRTFLVKVKCLLFRNTMLKNDTCGRKQGGNNSGGRIAYRPGYRHDSKGDRL